MRKKLGVFIFVLSTFSFQMIMPPNGKNLYKKAKCSSCHGRKGKSMLMKTGNLQNPNLTLEQRIQTITKGSMNDSRMIAFKEKFTTEEIRAIATYTMTFIKN